MSLYPTNLESSYSGVSTMAFNQIQFQHGMSIPEFLRCPEVRPAAFLLISVPPIMVSRSFVQTFPYARWIIMVTGRQKHLHEAKQGHQHEIQKPLVALPDLILFE